MINPKDLHPEVLEMLGIVVLHDAHVAARRTHKMLIEMDKYRRELNQRMTYTSGRLIVQNSDVYRVFDSVHDMFAKLINKPVLSQTGRLDEDVFNEADLEVANELLRTLEKLYGLRMGRPGTSPRPLGFDTPKMLAQYVQMKHWQKMLNMVFGPSNAKVAEPSSVIENTRRVPDEGKLG